MVERFVCEVVRKGVLFVLENLGRKMAQQVPRGQQKFMRARRLAMTALRTIDVRCPT